MGKYILLWNLFYKSSGKVISYLFILLFFILSFAFFALMTIESLNNSYKNYIFKNYIGEFGTIFFHLEGSSKKREKFLYQLQKEINYKSTLFVKKRIEFKINSIQKELEVVIWDKNREGINTILQKLLNSKKLFIENGEFKIKKEFKIIDTGFLNLTPTIFFNRTTAKQLSLTNSFDSIAFNVKISQYRIDKVKNSIEKIAQKNSIEYSIRDILSDNKIVLENLKKIEKLEFYIYFVTLLLAILIILFVLNIFMNLKRDSIYLFQVYGLKKGDISLFFSFIGTITIFISFLLGVIFFKFFTLYFKIILLNGVNFYLYSIILVMVFIFLNLFFKFQLKGIL